MLVYGRVWGPIKRLGIQGSSEGSPVKRAVWASAMICTPQWGYSHLKPQVIIQLLIWRSPGLTLPRVPQLKTPKAFYKNIKEIMWTPLSFCPRLMLKNSLLYIHLFSVVLLSFCKKKLNIGLFSYKIDWLLNSLMLGTRSPYCVAWDPGDGCVVHDAMVFLSSGWYICCISTCTFLVLLGMLKEDLYSLQTKAKPTALLSPALSEHLVCVCVCDARMYCVASWVPQGSVECSQDCTEQGPLCVLHDHRFLCFGGVLLMVVWRDLGGDLKGLGFLEV